MCDKSGTKNPTKSNISFHFSLTWIQLFFQGVVASSLVFNIMLYLVLKIIKLPKIQPAPTQSNPKIPTTSLNNIARNPVVMETLVVLLVFAINFIADVLTRHWLHQASKAETFNFSPIPQLVQTMMVGFWTPLIFFALNKKLREYATNEFFKVNISRKEKKIIPVVKVIDANQDLGQLYFETTKIEEFSEDVGKEYYKTIITHKDCEDCLAMPSTSSQTLLICAKHQETEKLKLRSMESKITFDNYIGEQIDNFSESSE